LGLVRHQYYNSNAWIGTSRTELRLFRGY
jgi:hypothetical protein